MSWINHPKFKYVLRKVIGNFKGNVDTFFQARPIIFLCGAKNSCIRDRINEYLKKQDKFGLFYADNVWETIAKHTSGNALKMEGELAKISDAVIIVVEGPGTFTELGAFSLNTSLRKKLIPILNKNFMNEISFINTGPVEWINNESKFSPVIWANFNSVLESAAEIDDRLKIIRKKNNIALINLSKSPKHLLLFLCDLIAVFGPSKLSHIKHYYQLAFNETPGELLTYLIGLATAMNLINKTDAEDDTDSLYYRSLRDNPKPFRMRKFFHLPLLRSEVLDALLSIEDGRNALKLVQKHSHVN